MKKIFKQKAILLTLVILISSLSCKSNIAFAGERDDDYYHVNSVINTNY